MNKGGLVTEVAKKTGLSKAEVGRVIDAAIDTVRETVVVGDRVTLADFGTFERKHRNRRIARNPRQPEVPIVVPERDLPAFTPGQGVPSPGARQQLGIARRVSPRPRSRAGANVPRARRPAAPCRTSRAARSAA